MKLQIEYLHIEPDDEGEPSWTDSGKVRQGILHHWGTTGHITENGPLQWTVGIVQDKITGNIVELLPRLIRVK